MKKTSYVFLICSLLFLAGCDLKEKHTRTLEMPLEISSGQKLTINTDVGSISVSETNSPQCSLKAEITGKGDTKEKAQQVAQSINIQIENKGGDVFVKIDKPSEIKSNWFEVSFTVSTPTDILLDCQTDVGSINVTNITGDIDAHTDVGSINVKNAGGRLNLKTDVGDIKAAYAPDAEAVLDADLSTDVGSIHFKGPENISARICASTDVGSIHSNLHSTDERIESNCCSKRLDATCGDGKGNVRLKTDVGSINIK